MAAITPSNILTDLDSMVVAIKDPMAMVMAKSKLEIFEKLRLPNTRVQIIMAT